MSRRGFSLIEMLVVVALLSVFMLVSMSLFRSLMGWMSVGSQAATGRHELHEPIAQMRADVWTAYSVAVGSESVAVLRQSGERTVTWELTTDARTAQRVLRRVSWLSPGGIAEAQPGARAKQIKQQQWPIRGGAVAFESRAGGMTIIRTTARGSSAEAAERRRLHLHSQVIMHRGAE